MALIKNKDIYDPSEGSPLKPIIDMFDLLTKKADESTKEIKKLIDSTINLNCRLSLYNSIHPLMKSTM